MAERQVLFDPVNVRGINKLGRAQRTTALGTFALQQMAFASTHTHHFSSRRDLEPLGHRLLCFNSFGPTHKISFLSKRARNIGSQKRGSKRYFSFHRRKSLHR